MYTLWGVAHSYYTGNIRSYLIKEGVAFRELYPTDPRFRAVVLPSVGLFVVPVLETPDGEILQDTSDLIDHFEARRPEPLMIPQTPVQRAVAWLLGAFGSEALLPPGMHYRWTYRKQQEEFLQAEFGRVNYAGPDRAACRAAGAQLMDYFNGFLPESWRHAGHDPRDRNRLPRTAGRSRHPLRAPCVPAGRPAEHRRLRLHGTVARALARDPVPATLMKKVAPKDTAGPNA